MKKLFVILFYGSTLAAFCQPVVLSDKTPPKEAKVVMNLTYFAYGADVFLSKADPIQIIIRGIAKDNDIPYPTTNIGIKLSGNLTYYVTFSIIDEMNPSSKVYVGVIKKQYGEFEKETVEKMQKTRIYPENNIYTETLALSNGMILTIENKKYVSSIYIPGYETYYFNSYEYKNKDE